MLLCQFYRDYGEFFREIIFVAYNFFPNNRYIKLILLERFYAKVSSIYVLLYVISRCLTNCVFTYVLMKDRNIFCLQYLISTCNINERRFVYYEKSLK